MFSAVRGAQLLCSEPSNCRQQQLQRGLVDRQQASILYTCQCQVEKKTSLARFQVILASFRMNLINCRNYFLRKNQLDLNHCKIGLSFTLLLTICQNSFQYKFLHFIDIDSIFNSKIFHFAFFSSCTKYRQSNGLDYNYS